MKTAWQMWQDVGDECHKDYLTLVLATGVYGKGGIDALPLTALLEEGPKTPVRKQTRRTFRECFPDRGGSGHSKAIEAVKATIEEVNRLMRGTPQQKQAGKAVFERLAAVSPQSTRELKRKLSPHVEWRSS